MVLWSRALIDDYNCNDVMRLTCA